MKYSLRLAPAFCVLVLLACSSMAENWPQWRGPNFNGSTSEAGLPDRLSITDNLLWSIDLPGHGAGTPIVWGDHVFVSAEGKGTRKLLALCYKRQTGELLWKREMGIGYGNPPGRLSDMTSPSAVTDGKTVYFSFGTGDLAAFDYEGRPLWSRNLQKDHGPFNMLYLYGATPLLHKGKLFIQVIHRNVPVANWGEPRPSDKLADSYLLAVDPATGKDIYKHIRPTDAKAESRESYCTPMPHEGNGRDEFVVVGGDYATGHDLNTGSELWRCGGWNTAKAGHLRMVPSVLVADDLVIICTPKAGGYVFAIRADGSGDISKTHIAWQQKQIACDVCIPLYYQGNLYFLDGDFKKSIYCVDPKTGQIKWSGKLNSRSALRTSPTGADGKIYCMNEAGDVWVLSANEFKVLSQISLESEGTARASITAAQGALFIRTGDKLYAFGKK